MDPGEQVLAKTSIDPCFFAGGAVQEFHHRQHLHPDLLLASLPAQLPERHLLHQVSPCLPPHQQLAQGDHRRVRLLCPDRLQGPVQD